MRQKNIHGGSSQEVWHIVLRQETSQVYRVWFPELEITSTDSKKGLLSCTLNLILTQNHDIVSHLRLLQRNRECQHTTQHLSTAHSDTATCCLEWGKYSVQDCPLLSLPAIMSGFFTIVRYVFNCGYKANGETETPAVWGVCGTAHITAVRGPHVWCHWERNHLLG